jgi:hypothetical protein
MLFAPLNLLLRQHHRGISEIAAHCPSVDFQRAYHDTLRFGTDRDDAQISVWMIRSERRVQDLPDLSNKQGVPQLGYVLFP